MTHTSHSFHNSFHRRGLSLQMMQEAMFTLVANEDDTISGPRSHWDGSPSVGYGSAPRRCHMPYLASPQRQDVNSGTEDLTPKTRRSRSISRTSMELKASGREIPWRILGRPQSYQNRFLEAINKEAESWSSRQSVEPLSFMEADNC